MFSVQGLVGNEEFFNNSCLKRLPEIPFQQLKVVSFFADVAALFFKIVFRLKLNSSAGSI